MALISISESFLSENLLVTDREEILDSLSVRPKKKSGFFLTLEYPVSGDDEESIAQQVDPSTDGN